MSRQTIEQALKTWEEKLATYECELSSSANPSLKFELRKGIQECQEEIERLKQRINLSEQDGNLDYLDSSSEPEFNEKTVELRLTRLYTPFQVPPLPSYFVARPEASSDLKNCLLEKNETTGTLVISAIHGFGGIGKSTLVAALAHERDVINRFRDGIFWATLGQEPDVLSLLTSWVQALGDHDFRPTNIDAASRHLCSLFHNKAALLVVDDVWNVDHALPFRIGDSECRVLITTRNADIARVVGATLYSLDVMTDQQALALLEGRIKRNFNDLERNQAKSLAEAVECLPLALELAAAQVTDGVSWAELLTDLQAEIARLDILDLPGAEDATDEITRKKLSLLASFNLSLRRLSEEKRQKFAWLGVVPEDVNLTQGMLTTLWEADNRTARDTLRYLRDKALLLEGVALTDGTRTYRLHDLLHDLSRHLLTSPPTPKRKDDLPGLGLNLPQAHAVMLERYRKLTGDSLWHQIPDDGYIHAYLTWHMEKAGWEDELHTLLKEETTEGQNGWYEVRDRLGQTAGYLADVTRAWKLAELAFSKCQSSKAIGLQIRYALIIASLNSLAHNIPPALLAALVEKEVWTAAQGLAYARQTPQLAKKAEALVRLAPHLPKSEQGLIQREALTHALAIHHPGERGQALAPLAPHIPESMLEEVLREIQVIDIDWWKGEGLVMLAACYLPESLSNKMLLAVQTIENQYIQSRMLGKITPYLAISESRIATQKLREVLKTRLALVKRDLKNYCELENYIELISCLPYALQRDRLPEIRAIILKSIDENNQYKTELEKIDNIESQLNSHKHEIEQYELQHFSTTKNESQLAEFLTNILRIQDNNQKNKELTKLVPYLSKSLLHQSLMGVKTIQDKAEQSFLLIELAPDLPKELYEEILKIVLTIQDKNIRDRQLVTLVPILPEILLREVIQILDKFDDLVALSPYLSESLFNKLLTKLAISLKKEPTSAKYLIKLIPCLPSNLMNRFLEIALTIRDVSDRVSVLQNTIIKLTTDSQNNIIKKILIAIQDFRDSKENHMLKAHELEIMLISKLPEPWKNTVISNILSLVDKMTIIEEKERLLMQLIPNLPSSLLQQLLSTQAFDNKHLQALAILYSASQSNQSQLEEGLNAIQNICKISGRGVDFYNDNFIEKSKSVEEAKASILTRLIPYLPASLMNKALMISREIKDDLQRVKILIVLVPCLPESMQERMLREDIISSNSNELQVIAFAELAIYFSRFSLLGEMLDILRKRHSKWSKLKIIKKILEYNPALLEELFDIAREIYIQEGQPGSLTELLPCVPSTLKVNMIKEILEIVLITEYNESQKGILRTLYPYMINIPAITLHELWGKILHVMSRRSRENLLFELCALTPVIKSLGGIEAVEETAHAIQDIGRWFP